MNAVHVGEIAICDAAGKRNSPHAFMTDGWCHPYPDPATLNVSFDTSRFDDPVFNRRLQRAARL